MILFISIGVNENPSLDCTVNINDLLLSPLDNSNFILTSILLLLYHKSHCVVISRSRYSRTKASEATHKLISVPVNQYLEPKRVLGCCSVFLEVYSTCFVSTGCPRKHAKSSELRAVTGLRRLWQQKGKRAEAREMLTNISSADSKSSNHFLP